VSYFNLKQQVALARSLVTKTSPAYVQFYITARCNLACEQCNIIYADANAQEMNIDQIRAMAENMARIGVCIVLLIGGEPFVRKDLPEIVKAFSDVGIHVRLQTNGLATRKAVEACITNGAHDISISLDSLRPNLQETINGGFTKSWDRAIDTMAMVNDIFPDTGTAFFNSVLMPRNMNDIPDVVRFGKEIGWGMSLVPVHVATSDDPRGYRTLVDTDVVTFTPEQYPEVRRVIETLKTMKRDGYYLYDSDQYLEDIYRFVTGQPIEWRKRNGGVCDSPNLYFAVAPNGNMKVCCDYELDTAYPVYHPDFPEWYYGGRIHDDVYRYTRACDGCMYGSYPEITISARYLEAMLERFVYFNVAPPKLKKITGAEMREIAREIANASGNLVSPPPAAVIPAKSLAG
jgi:MoaA/NifB/PqqE/SkfB family radical SAM enzyme